MDSRECAKSISELLAGNVPAWEGIGSQCRVDDVRELLSVDDAWGGGGYLGEKEWDAEYVGVGSGSSNNEGRLWHDAEGRLLLVELIEPEEFPSAEGLTQILGQPDARLDAPVGLRTGRENEWVYPGRGLAFYIAPDGATVERAVGFGHSTLDLYRRRLRLNLKQHRL